jgi:hypothetical protein
LSRNFDIALSRTSSGKGLPVGRRFCDDVGGARLFAVRHRDYIRHRVRIFRIHPLFPHTVEPGMRPAKRVIFENIVMRGE